MKRYLCCITLLSVVITSQADELGRLFFTPEQRLQLQLKQQPSDEELDNPSALTVNGIVQKEGGKRTVWLNGIAQASEKSDVHAPDSSLIEVPGQSRPVRIKVGQKAVLTPPISAARP